MRVEPPIAIAAAEHDEGPLFSSFADDPEMGELIERFVSGLGAQVAEAERALALRDAETARHVAHRLKGAAGGYGFDAITKAAADFERAAKLLTNMHGRRATLAGLPRQPSAAERVNAEESLRVLAKVCRRASSVRHANEHREAS